MRGASRAARQHQTVRVGTPPIPKSRLSVRFLSCGVLPDASRALSLPHHAHALRACALCPPVSVRRPHCARASYSPVFSRLSLRAFVHDVNSRAQVDVDSHFLARDRPSAASDSSGCRCVRSLSLAQPPFTHPNLTSCVCRSLSRRRRRSQLHPPQPVLLSTSFGQIAHARARARLCSLVVVLVLLGCNDIR